jgi:hypothetical protein
MYVEPAGFSIRAKAVDRVEPRANHRRNASVEKKAVEHLLWEEVLSLPWRAETSNLYGAFPVK